MFQKKNLQESAQLPCVNENLKSNPQFRDISGPVSVTFSKVGLQLQPFQQLFRKLQRVERNHERMFEDFHLKSIMRTKSTINRQHFYLQAGGTPSLPTPAAQNRTDAELAKSNLKSQLKLVHD